MTGGRASAELSEVAEGGFSFLKGGLAYSQGVVAQPGFAIEHVRFFEPVAVDEGFIRIEDYLRERGRPVTALCAVELRSPRPMLLDGFREFNAAYAAVLQRWGLVQDDVNSVARSNVAPIFGAPATTGFHAFSFTARADHSTPTFVVSGSSEWPEGGRFPEDVVRYGETNAEAMRAKTSFVLAAMERRMHGLGVAWADATITQSYSEHDVFEFLVGEVMPRGAARGGVVWQFCKPPVVGWDYEMDVKGVLNSYVVR